MPDAEGAIEFHVNEIGGRRLFKARRLSSGNWLLVETNGMSRRTITHADFTRGYERTPRNDRQAG